MINLDFNMNLIILACKIPFGVQAPRMRRNTSDHWPPKEGVLSTRKPGVVSLKGGERDVNIM